MPSEQRGVVVYMAQLKSRGCTGRSGFDPWICFFYSHNKSRKLRHTEWKRRHRFFWVVVELELWRQPLEGLQKRCRSRWEILLLLTKAEESREKKIMLHFDNHFFWATSYDFIRSRESSGTQGADLFLRGMKANRSDSKSKTDLK